MKNNKLASVYAKALFETAQPLAQLDQTLNSLTLLTQSLRENPNFRLFLANPVISKSEKKLLIQNSFDTKISELAHKFISLLIDKKRTHYLDDIIEQFAQRIENSKNILRALVTSCQELSADQITKIEQELAKRYPGKSFHLDKALDPHLVGGFTIRIGDTIIDASIRQKLMLLKRKLAA